ncbi:MAG: hypothetical protein EOM69_11420, partial [Clostridia bacterium]|nr:hypothetical protein [Clostridia bacterium]
TTPAQGRGAAAPPTGPVHGPATRAVVQPSGAATALALAPDTDLARFARFDDVLELIRRMRDVKLLVEVETHLRLVRYAPGRIEFEPTPDAPRDLAANLAARLQGWTGARWGVSVTSAGNMIVIKTIAGSANAAAEAVDTLKWPDILGSIAGDNTIFIAVRDAKSVGDIIKKFQKMLK